MTQEQDIVERLLDVQGDNAALAAEAVEKIKELEAQLETANALVTCMCGNSVDHSGWEGHSPVSQYHYTFDTVMREREAAEAKVKEMERRELDMEAQMKSAETEAERIKAINAILIEALLQRQKP